MPLTRAGLIRVALLAAGLVLLAVLFARLGPARILSLLSALGTNFVAVVLVFTCHESVRALAIGRFFPAGERPAWRTLLRVRLVGDAVGAITRTGLLGAEPVRAWLLAGTAGTGTQAYAAIASELVANSSTSATLTAVVAGWMLLTVELHGPILVLCHILCWSSLAFVSSAAGAIQGRIYLIGGALRAVGALPIVGPHLRADPVRVRATEDAIIHSLTSRPSTVVQVFALECLAQAILVYEVLLTIRSMGGAVDAPDALFVEVLTKAANIVQLVGVTEAGYAVVFDWLGLTATLGFTLSLVKVLRSLAAAGLGLSILSQVDRYWLVLASTLRASVRPDAGGGDLV
ncbi:MAG: hypothetical protein AB7O28_19645 [Vicinamibacterales bacterium]